jgi:hypothetical protein
MLVKVAATTEYGTPAAAAVTITSKTSTRGNQQDSADDKSKEETVKTELPISQSYMTSKQNNKNNDVNPFALGTEVRQSLMTYWLNAYGEFLKNASRMTE